MELESKENSVVRRDMVGQDCVVCPFGTYQETALYDAIDQLIQCNVCGDEMHRFKSKSELAKHIQKRVEELA